jgi:hypothetical protein
MEDKCQGKTVPNWCCIGEIAKKLIQLVQQMGVFKILIINSNKTEYKRTGNAIKVYEV